MSISCVKCAEAFAGTRPAAGATPTAPTPTVPLQRPGPTPVPVELDTWVLISVLEWSAGARRGTEMIAVAAKGLHRRGAGGRRAGRRDRRGTACLRGRPERRRRTRCRAARRARTRLPDVPGRRRAHEPLPRGDWRRAARGAAVHPAGRHPEGDAARIQHRRPIPIPRGGSSSTSSRVRPARHPVVESGRFGERMQVRLCNEGPVTFWLETRAPAAGPPS